MITSPIGGPGIGYFPPNIDVVVYNRSGSAFAVGDVVQLDLASSATESVTENPGGTEGTTTFSNAIAPTAAGIKAGILGVALEVIADDAKGRIRLQGFVDQAFIIDGTDSVAIGDPLVATTAKNLDAVLAVNERIIGIAQTAHTTPTTRTLGKVLFNGITGFGMECGT